MQSQVCATQFKIYSFFSAAGTVKLFGVSRFVLCSRDSPQKGDKRKLQKK